MPDGGGEKTEKATPKKRRDAREKEGNVLQSKEVGIAVSVLGIFLLMSLIGGYMLNMLTTMVTDFLGRLGDEHFFTSEFMTNTSLEIAKYVFLIVGPVLAGAITFALIPAIIQTKGLFTTKPLAPKLSRISPLGGFKRLFSIQSVVNIIKGILEILVIIVIIYFKIQDILIELKELPDMDIIQGVIYIGKNVFSIIMTVCVLLVAIAAFDYVFQWWQFEKKLKMSKQEIKDEYKQIEGDPLIKSKIKQKQREIAQMRMLGDVPDSDVVVRNPTHYAVAIKYDRENAYSAPKVLAKGKDHIALKIIDIAKEHDIYIIEERQTARKLYEDVEVGHEITAELYNAVAIILTEMYEAKGIKFDEVKRKKK